jgi:hypothetical protein
LKLNDLAVMNEDSNQPSLIRVAEFLSAERARQKNITDKSLYVTVWQDNVENNKK